MVSEETYRELYNLLAESRGKRVLPRIPIEELTHAESHVVMFVGRAEKLVKEVRPSTLAQMSKMTPSALSQIIKTLTKKGIVERGHRSEDYRAVYITLTPKGREYAERIEAAHLQHIRELADYIGEDDLIDLIRIIKKVNEYHEEHAEAADGLDSANSLLERGRTIFVTDGACDA